MPDWSRALLAWDIWAVVSGVSLILCAASALAVPWIARRLRADYLVRPSLPPEAPLSPGRIALRVLKNLAGVILFIAGIAMLALPGQGILTMVVALIILDLPGKRRLLSRFIGAPPVFRAINVLRRRGHVQPLSPPPKRHRESS